MENQKPREIAFRVLRRREGGAGFVEHELDREFERAALSPADRGLAQELTYGVVRWQAALDWLIARKTAGRVQKPPLQDLLRLGLYQMLWLERIPDHAAVNETVELARHSGFGAQAGFVNALLRRYTREKELTRRLLEELKRSDPAVGWSHPAWLVERWTARWSPEQTAPLLAWNNTAARTYARANALRADPGTLLARWREEGIAYDFGHWDWAPENTLFELKSHPPLRRLATFEQGWFYVQDPSTLLAVHLLDPQPGEAVLDLCAAPGGKTLYIAQQMQNLGRLVARDASPERLDLLQANCARLGATGVVAELAPPVPRPAVGAPQFDRVLVDAPCSNTGVLRRRVDLRWRLRAEEIERLHARQVNLLSCVVSELRPHGTLVYSTCSLEPEENRAVVDAVLALDPSLHLAAERELVPFRDGVDGAYVAVIRRC